VQHPRGLLLDLNSFYNFMASRIPGSVFTA
jgi:hypothetical protein